MMRDRPGVVYNILPAESAKKVWLFRFVNEHQGRISIRAEYRRYRCSGCDKVDELSALSEPLPLDLRINSKLDVIASLDDFIFVGSRFRELCERAGLRGLEFRDLPGDPHFWLAMPTCLVETDEATAGFEYRGPRCVVCGRHRESSVGPLVQSLDMPSDPLMIFSSKIWTETPFGRMPLLFCHEKAFQSLKGAKLVGVDFLEAE